MKKVLFVLMVLAISAPALATVTISALQDISDCNHIFINYSATGEPNLVRAFALKLSVDSGAKIIAIDSYKTNGESTAASPGYGIYMGSIQIDQSGSVTDYNNPVAPSNAPDSPPQLDSNAIIIEMGSLYEGAPNAPGNDANLCAIWVDGECTLTIASDSTRGGVVLEDSNNPSTLVLNGTEVVCLIECFDSGHTQYAEWLSVGSPDCWCNMYHCCGDADNLKRGNPKSGYFIVEYGDIGILTNSWKRNPSYSTYNICADFNRKKDGNPKSGYYRVEYADIGILTVNWKKVDSVVDANCLTAMPGGACGGNKPAPVESP